MALPIRNRLVAWHACILAVLLLLFTGGLYLALRYHLNREVNESLLAWAAENYGIPEKRPHRDNSGAGRAADAMLPESFSMILDEKGRSLSDHSLTPAVAARLRRMMAQIRVPRGKRRDEETVAIHDQWYRIFLFPLVQPDGRRSYRVVGRSLEHVNSSLAGLAVFLGSGWLVAVAACTVISWSFVGRTLRPVNLMTRDSLQIAASGQLGRRIANLGWARDEFGELCQALNQMLSSLEGSYETQRKFLADASHELRTPLTSIKANLDFLNHATKLPEAERSQVLRDIAAEVDRMAGLVHELLLLARVEGQSHPERLPVDLAAIVREAVSGFLHGPAADRRLTLQAPDSLPVLGEADKLKQLLIILLDNALKYTTGQGRIEVWIGNHEGEPVVSVSDDGPGIPEAELPLVGNRFYRASNIRGTPGSGLGLAIARSIAAHHQATLQLSNRQPTGLRVEIKFPRYEEDHAQ
jgi:two-component system OmpR family sensor kinase